MKALVLALLSAQQAASKGAMSGVVLRKSPTNPWVFPTSAKGGYFEQGTAKGQPQVRSRDDVVLTQCPTVLLRRYHLHCHGSNRTSGVGGVGNDDHTTVGGGIECDDRKPYGI